MNSDLNPPEGLGRLGRAEWDTVTTANELEPGEQHLLERVCRTLDRLAELGAVIERDGVAGEDGHVNQAVREERLLQDSLARLIKQLHHAEDGVPRQARRKYGSQNWPRLRPAQ